MPDLTADEFVAENPHFDNESKKLIQLKLDYAKAVISETQFENDWRQAVTLLASHLLSISPRGQKSRLDPNDARTTYLEQYEALMHCHTAGPRVI